MTTKPRSHPWIPPDYDYKDVEAFKALSGGTADAAQQTRALRWIIEQAAGTYELSFRSDADGGERDTSFAEGRRFVGLLAVKMINMPIEIAAKMRTKNG